MSGRLTQALLGLSLLLNCFVLAGFVYRSWIAPPRWERAGPPPRGGPVEMLSQELNLNEVQRKALRALFEQNAAERRERNGAIQKVREQMGEELAKPQIDMNKVEPLIVELARLRGEQMKDNLNTIAQLAGQLTPEQHERLHRMIADRFGGRGGRPPGEQRPGPGAGRPPQ